MNCPVKTETVADFIRAVTTHGWKIKRIVNNDSHADKAICLITCNDSSNKYVQNIWWVRVEIEPDETCAVYYYHVDEYNFVDYFFDEVFSTVGEVANELCLINA